MFSLNAFSSSSACSPNATTCSRSRSCSSCSCSCSCPSATTTSCGSQSNISSFLSSFANRLIKSLFMIIMKVSFVLLRFSLSLDMGNSKN
ncbi:hypothetical protein RO3G_04158 [Rhizopus delemar RA 99-880]|uniref:Uncharacterized protein n=1 Tax=Rhizopus delemar (strain RA 99-880 / ATCC MYA-4621 / FGSC 9543 / NRRL 43880) TaxID=246409 RepID=I1BTC3_RHIO9|nr:hypothetical protein RO3G_04158 [Rhizopus delemar RA 99-880]|eukprot:EIE79453.1 hypothetical protein RO3G_04158 [Rhizopus delemar RA 99-880]